MTDNEIIAKQLIERIQNLKPIMASPGKKLSDYAEGWNDCLDTLLEALSVKR
jgi:hypothetical protein